MTRENLHWLGQWEIIVHDRDGNILDRTGLRPNLIVDAGLNMVRDALGGFIVDAGIKYIALGNGSTPPASGQTQLMSEKFRKQITDHIAMSDAGALETVSYISANEGNDFVTEEIGWFAGAAASGSPNSGIMVARVLYGRQKNSLEVWTIRRVDSLRRG